MILLNNEPQNRCVILADYIITNRATVRKTAAYYGISKSTVHKDVTEKLQRINRGLYDEVKVILDFNKAERHIRGGEATKIKYLTQNNVKSAAHGK